MQQHTDINQSSVGFVFFLKTKALTYLHLPSTCEGQDQLTVLQILWYYYNTLQVKITSPPQKCTVCPVASTLHACQYWPIYLIIMIYFISFRLFQQFFLTYSTTVKYQYFYLCLFQLGFNSCAMNLSTMCYSYQRAMKNSLNGCILNLTQLQHLTIYK